MPVHPVTLTLDTAAYADGDVLADTQLVAANVGRAGKEAYIDSVTIQDDDDQGGILTLVFLSSNTSIGTENSAPNISDANVAAAVISQLGFVAADYVDFGGARLAVKANLNMALWIPDGGSLYVAAISKDTKTYTANGLKVKISIKHR